MSRRDRRRQRRETGSPPLSTAPTAASTASAVAQAAPAGQPGAAPWFRDPWVWVVATGAIALVLFSAYKFWPVPNVLHNPGEEFAQQDPPPNPEPGGKQTEPESFLDEFTKGDAEADKDPAGGVLANRDLEKQFQALLEINDRLRDLIKRGAILGAEASDEELQRVKEVQALFDRKAAALEKDLGKAREARPRDAVPRWLTGELLMLVGGDPEVIIPHLKYAADSGLSRPRVAGSLARTQLEANRFADSYRTAAAGLDQFGQDRYLWDGFARTALCNQQFEPLIERLARSFPTGLPDWAKIYERDAKVLQAKWDAEQRIRAAEARANDLPRVRLVIEHRRFGRDPDGKPLTTVESAGGGVIVLELFENEAPLTVANFIDLVTRKVYDGTRFHRAVPATSVVGGDPNSTKEDPKDDGAGGPGYVIADEYQAKNARNHFRGSISMVKTRPHTAGSQFFISLAPAPEMDGHFTVFGRILEGQEVADQITRGRTHPDVAKFGRLIPGDLLVRAEVVRKRRG